MLLPEVVAMLSTAQSMMLPPGAISELGSLEAASLGAGGAIRTEPVSPVQKKCLARAFRYAGFL